MQVIERFKKNEFNVLVCTSIGEEGLDIGEVDYIICYDSHKAPIKMVCGCFFLRTERWISPVTGVVATYWAYRSEKGRCYCRSCC